MTAIVFPSTVPGPSMSTVTPVERRLLSDLTGGPQGARGVQRDYLGTQSLEWSLLDPIAAAALDNWWTTDLILGGAWFASTWPAPQGWVSLARRFLGVPKWTHLAGGFWRVTAQVLVRGRGMAPQTPQYPTLWDPVASSAQWAITGASAVINSSNFAASGGSLYAFKLYGDHYCASGKRYFEVSIGNLPSFGTNADFALSHSGYIGLAKASFADFMTATLDIGLFVSAALTSNPYGSSPYSAGVFDTVHPNWPGSAIAVIMVCCDLGSGHLWFGKNGSWFGVDPGVDASPVSTALAGPVTPFVMYDAAISNAGLTLHSTSSALVYPPPTGFVPWAA